MLNPLYLLCGYLFSCQITFCRIIITTAEIENDRNKQHNEFGQNLNGKTEEIINNGDDENKKNIPTKFLHEFMVEFPEAIGYPIPNEAKNRKRKGGVKLERQERFIYKTKDDYFHIWCVMDSKGYSILDLIKCIGRKEWETSGK